MKKLALVALALTLAGCSSPAPAAPAANEAGYLESFTAEYGPDTSTDKALELGAKICGQLDTEAGISSLKIYTRDSPEGMGHVARAVEYLCPQHADKINP